MFVFLPYWSIF